MLVVVKIKKNRRYDTKNPKNMEDIEVLDEYVEIYWKTYVNQT